MTSAAWVVLAAAFLLSAEEQVSVPSYQGQLTLLERALQQDSGDRSARPSGQCLVSCGDRLVEVDTCPNGTCPIVDCAARTISCPAR